MTTTRQRHGGRQLGRFTLVLALMLVACGGQVPAPSDSPNNGAATPSHGPSNATPGASGGPGAWTAECAATVEDAERLAETLLGADAATAIEATLPCFGVAIVPDDADEATLGALRDGGQPFVMAADVAALGDRSDEGFLFDLNSLIQELGSQGLQSASTGEIVDRQAFDDIVSSVATRDGPAGALARLLTALGRVRVAERGTDAVDPMWGEPRLDALQFLLLGTAFAAIRPDGEATLHVRLASTAAFPFVDAPVAQAVPPVEGLGASFRVGVRRAFLSYTWAACAAKHAKFTSVLTDATPTDLWHQNGRDPFTGPIRFTLVRTAMDDFAWTVVGCAVPDRGTPLGPYDGIPGRSVSWQSDGAADQHGSLSNHRFTTTQSGEVEATYTTIPETTPEDEQIPENESTERVSFTIEVTGLVPGMPSTVMVKPTATKALTVHWYEPGPYRLVIDMDFVGANDAFASNVRVHGEITLSPDEPPPNPHHSFSGEAKLSFTTSPQSGDCKFLWTGQGFIDAGAGTVITEPFDPTTFEVHLGMDLGSVPPDSVFATKCGVGGSGGKPTTSRLSLVVLFISGNWADVISPTNPTITFNGWRRSSEPGVLAVRTIAGSCGIPTICQLRGELRLERN